jgi:c-di-GMP-binding flagellar brake protein YcgR
MVSEWDEPELPGTEIEQRRHVRVEAELAVTFGIAGDGACPPLRADTRDISHGGACLAASGCTGELLEKLARLPLLELTIHAVPGATFAAGVEWVRRPAAAGDPALVGIAFRALSIAQEMAIIDLIAHVLICSRAPSSPAEAEPAPAGFPR